MRFGGRDHTTVLHACRLIRELIETDGKLREDWDKLVRKLSGVRVSGISLVGTACGQARHGSGAQAYPQLVQRSAACSPTAFAQSTKSL